MRAIYLDCFAGISGNMLLGAFLQAGVSADALQEELKKLPIQDEYALHIDNVQKNGICTVYVDVELEKEVHGHCHETEEPHGHEHSHDHAAGEHHEHAHHHSHRTWASIREMIESSSLTERVKAQSKAIFEHLAEAEGKIHGKPKDEVAFHEVGAVDSIVDIVGTAICLEQLAVERVMVSRVNTGSGFVSCAHGLMPVPAPATAELLRGFPSYHQGAEKELTTPTGAAVIRALATYEENMPQAFIVDKIAYGAGFWDLDIPNVLRLYLGDMPEE
ncbi:MAG: nickel pincer cofactor biosynthesis protein LarC [Schwartzia sp.]|nr:nickel pincer cofactor biosynthesis protein LarC [Schwartzia sp. (in: firmicutes)]